MNNLHVISTVFCNTLQILKSSGIPKASQPPEAQNIQIINKKTLFSILRWYNTL